MTPKVIIYVIGSLNVGGAERHLVQVLPRLDRSRWKPVVYCLTERGLLADQLEAQGVQVLCSPVPSPRQGLSRVRRLILIAKKMLSLMGTMRRLKPAIAHFYLPAAYILGAPAALLARVPIRIMSRRSLNVYQQGHPFSAWIERGLHLTMNAVLGNSRRVVEQLRREERVPLRKLGLIYNGIDLAHYGRSTTRLPMRAGMDIAPDTVVFMIVANLIPYKGHSDLIEGFGIAASRLHADWRLLVVGRDDGIETVLRQQALDLGISNNTTFLGPRHDVGDLFSCADVNLLSSHQEGFSNSVIEGMAAGLPSIVTDVGGNAEAVIDGECGLVVPPHSPESFAAAIETLAENSELRARMGRSARRRVEEHFAIEACSARYQHLYDGLLAGRQPREIDDINPEAIHPTARARLPA